MLFQGDISKYHPADALMFLCNLNLNGLFSVAAGESMITLSFKDGKLLDAHSARGDQKILRCLQYKGIIDNLQCSRISQIQSETGLSVRQILAQLKQVPLADIKDTLLTGILEVLLELFLLENGTFNFTDAPVEGDAAGIHVDIGKAALKVMVQADEFRDFEKSNKSVERLVEVNPDRKLLKELSAGDQLVVKLALQRLTVRQLLEKAATGSSDALKSLAKLLNQGVLRLADAPEIKAPASPAKLDPIFASYKQALKTLLGATEVLTRLEAVISFCKTYYDGMLILTARNGELAHCKMINSDPARGLTQKTIASRFGRIEDHPVFSAVYRSGVAFFGDTFPCDFLERLLQNKNEGDCALIPIYNRADLAMFFYACINRKSEGLSPHHYLELLSWMITPARKAGARPLEAVPDRKAAAPARGKADSGNDIARLIAGIEELPPLPALVSRTLSMLSNPDTPIWEIEKVISQDQAIVTKLIKVGNSALYCGLQKAGTLRQVLARIGAKTTRSLILATSTRGYFLNNQRGMKVWGQLLWQHAVECGLAARRIAAEVNVGDPEEAFTGGLIHDVGRLVILMLFPDKFKEIQQIKKVEQATEIAIERQVLGTDHEQVGRLLMDKWNMPDAVKACTEYHHRHEEAGPYTALAAITAYADQCSHFYGLNQHAPLPVEKERMDAIKAMFGIDEPAHAKLLETILSDFQNTDLLT